MGYKNNVLKPKLLRQLLTVSLLLSSSSAFASEASINGAFTKTAVDAPVVCDLAQNTVCYPNILGRVDRINADNAHVWQNPIMRQELLQQLQAVADSDLLPGMHKRIKHLETLAELPNSQEYDLFAQDTFLIYLNFVHQILRQPQLLFNPKSIMLPPLTYVNVASYFPITEQKLIQLRPTNNFLDSMRVIQLLEQLPPHALSMTAFSSVIRLNQTIPFGHDLVQVLYDLGDLTASEEQALLSETNLTNSGVINTAIKHFQARNGLDDDGIIGPQTARVLTRSYRELARVIALNLQRSRLNKLDETKPHLQVNVPDYQLRIFENNHVIFDSKVIVGRPSRPTNLFSSKINTMVVNPSWNVPETIKRKDILPKLQHDPAYLKEHNFHVLKSWRDRTLIPAESIDWATVDPATFPYEFQQGPGPHNSLGTVKFLMPNGYSIFLHDTPVRQLFDRHQRDLSSGCVRVQKAAELANFIIEYQASKKMPTFDVMLSSDKEDTFPLHHRLNVDFVYLTAWLDETGHLQMRPDIYHYDVSNKTEPNIKFISMKNYR